MLFNNRSYHNFGFIIMPFESKESHETKPVNRLELSEVWINWMRRKVYFLQENEKLHDNILRNKIKTLTLQPHLRWCLVIQLTYF